MLSPIKLSNLVARKPANDLNNNCNLAILFNSILKCIPIRHHMTVILLIVRLIEILGG